MMTEVPLANQVKRGGEQKCHRAACQVVPKAVGKKHGVFRLVDDRVDRVHHHAETHRQQTELPPMRDVGQRQQADGNRRQLRGHQGQVDAIWNHRVCPHGRISSSNSLNGNHGSSHQKTRCWHHVF